MLNDIVTLFGCNCTFTYI